MGMNGVAVARHGLILWENEATSLGISFKCLPDQQKNKQNKIYIYLYDHPTGDKEIVGRGGGELNESSLTDSLTGSLKYFTGLPARLLARLPARLSARLPARLPAGLPGRLPARLPDEFPC